MGRSVIFGLEIIRLFHSQPFLFAHNFLLHFTRRGRKYIVCGKKLAENGHGLKTRKNPDDRGSLSLVSGFFFLVFPWPCGGRLFSFPTLSFSPWLFFFLFEKKKTPRERKMWEKRKDQRPPRNIFFSLTSITFYLATSFLSNKKMVMESGQGKENIFPWA